MQMWHLPARFTRQFLLFFARSKLMQIHFFLQSSALRVPHSFHTEKKNFSSLCVKNVRSVPRVWSQNTSNGN